MEIENTCPYHGDNVECFVETDAVPVVLAPVEGAFSNSYACTREDCFGAKEALA